MYEGVMYEGVMCEGVMCVGVGVMYESVMRVGVMWVGVMRVGVMWVGVMRVGVMCAGVGMMSAEVCIHFQSSYPPFSFRGGDSEKHVILEASSRWILIRCGDPMAGGHKVHQ